MIEPTALRALTVLAGTGTVARAAHSLGYTPSAVSQQIKRLEAQVGVPLLARAGRGVVLTPAGEALVGSAPEVFESLERVAEAARSTAAEPSGLLRVVAFSTAIRGLLAPALPALRAAHPQLTLAVDEQDPQRAVHSVSTGSADLALLHDADGIPTPVPGTLDLTHLHDDAGDVLVHASHPLARRKTVSSTDLRGQSWVTSPPGTVCHQWFERLLADQPEPPDVRHRVDDFSTQIALVATAGVVALVPRLARPALPADVVPVRVDPAPTRRVDAAWRRSSGASPAVRAVLAALQPAPPEAGLTR